MAGGGDEPARERVDLGRVNARPVALGEKAALGASLHHSRASYGDGPAREIGDYPTLVRRSPSAEDK